MATIWKSTNQKHANHTTNLISGKMLTSWSRQQKLAMIAGFAMLGLLLVISACSKQSSKPALVAVSSPAPKTIPTTSAETAPAAPAPVTAPSAAAKKTPKAKKRPANVSYTNSDAGVSFLYPRKFTITSGDKAQPELAAIGEVPMNFVQSGGVTVATVTAPSGSYPGTDFSSAFFSVNVNHNISEEECGQFAFLDTRNADGEPVDAEKVKVGTSEMETTSSASASMMKQAEAQYYHSFEGGACYEYVLGLGTAGYGATEGIEHVDRDEVFARLDQILATVKIDPVVTGHSAELDEPTIASSNENH